MFLPTKVLSFCFVLFCFYRLNVNNETTNITTTTREERKEEEEEDEKEEEEEVTVTVAEVVVKEDTETYGESTVTFVLQQ